MANSETPQKRGSGKWAGWSATEWVIPECAMIRHGLPENASGGLRRRILLLRELSLLRPPPPYSLAERSFRVTGEDEPRLRRFHQRQPGTRLRLPWTVC